MVVVDRVAHAAKSRSRLIDSLEQSFGHGAGKCAVYRGEKGAIERFDTALRCPDCDLRFAEPTAAQFSFNHPSGACPVCSGFGRTLSIDEALLVPDPKKTLAEGAIKPWTTPATAWERRDLKKWSAERGVPLDVPYEKLSQKHKDWLWKGEEGAGARAFGGESTHGSSGSRPAPTKCMCASSSRAIAARACVACGGTRFRPDALKVRVDGKSIADLYRMPIGELRSWFTNYRPPAAVADAVDVVLGEVRARLGYLCEVGLGYLTLDRSSRSLSGGEMEQVNLTTAVGSRLVNALFVLDEPSVGLHPRDNDRLIGILRRLVKLGNSVVVVEHDPALLLASDELIDLGPGAGAAGGEIVYQGNPSEAAGSPTSLTGAWLSGRRAMPTKRTRRRAAAPWLTVRGARALIERDRRALPAEDLHRGDGVSGSGKSTLVEDVLYRRLRRLRGETTEEPGESDGIDGAEHLAEVVLVDATPIGRSSKSIVATSCGAYDGIRKALASLPEARLHRFSPSTFSFNVSGGRCEACEGAGFERVEMQFLADVELPCSDCGGTRFRPEVRRVKLKGKTIGEILDLTVEEASKFFEEDDPTIRRRFAPLAAVGLGYLRIGQSVNALSGGEAQRLKLATAIAEDFESPQTNDRGAHKRGRSSFSMSPPPASTSTTWRSSSRPSSGSSISATR